MGLKIFSDLIAKLRNIPADKFMLEIAPEILPLVEQLNREQLESGLTIEGQNNKIRPKYKGKKYADKKNAMNPKPGKGTPDLKLKGDFHAGIKATLGANVIYITSTDFKAPFLLGKYQNILGLTPKNLTLLRQEYVKPLLTKRVINHILHER
jgi:hypothetical protein